jgi:hypothetical protein
MTNITRRAAIFAAALAPIAAQSATTIATPNVVPDAGDTVTEAADDTLRFMADMHSGVRVEGRTYLFYKPLKIVRPELLNFHNCDFTWLLEKAEKEDTIVSFEYHIEGTTDVFTEVNRFRTVVI